MAITARYKFELRLLVDVIPDQISPSINPDKHPPVRPNTATPLFTFFVAQSTQNIAPDRRDC